MNSRQERIEQCLRTSFSPSLIRVLNESHGHNVPAGSETHFKVTLVSKAFAGQGRVKRHQAVYAALGEEMQGGLHALALHLYTPDEWSAQAEVPASPACRGGSKEK